MWISPSRARERQIPLFSVETQSHLGSVESFPIRKRSGVDDWTGVQQKPRNGSHQNVRRKLVKP